MLAEGASSDRRTELRERERRRTMERIIFHCDLNSFYASVELLDHPELRHLPVAVCGDPESRHGIILENSRYTRWWAGRSTRSGHFRLACQMVSAVLTPHRLAGSFLAKMIPWREAGSPHTAVGTSRRSGRESSSTEA